MDNPIDIAAEQLKYRKYPQGDIYKYAAEKDCENWGLCKKRTRIIAFFLVLLMIVLISLVIKRRNLVRCEVCREYISNCICDNWVN